MTDIVTNDGLDGQGDAPASLAQNARLLERIKSRTARVVVVGQGYVGLPVAMRSSEVGFPTIGFEVDRGRLADLNSGISYVGDVSNDELSAAIDRGYTSTCEVGDLSGFDIAVVTVPTPLREGAPDLSYIEVAARSLARVLRSGALVVLESTTYPGTTEEYFGPILAESGLRMGKDFFLGYSPERIDPGNPNFGFVNTPKVVSGLDAASCEVVAEFYAALVDEVVPVDTCAEAELVKILENTYRHVNIALVNELAMFSRDLGVDIWTAIDAAATKPFGFTAFRPGPGVGGHCLPIDPSYLSWRVRNSLGRTFRFVELANDVNGHMPDYVVERVGRQLNQVGLAINGQKILLLGVAYKAGTSDWRESPSIVVARKLGELGAELSYCDPYVAADADLGIDAKPVEFGPAALGEADLVVVLVDHKEFVPEEIAEHSQLIFDAKAIMRGHDMTGDVL